MPLTSQQKILALVEHIARMATEEETEGGMTSEDAFATLNDLIASAREITGIDPQYPKLYCVFCGCDVADCDCQEFIEPVLDARTREG